MPLKRPIAPAKILTEVAVAPKVSAVKTRDEALSVAGVLVPQLEALVAKPVLASASKTFLAIDDIIARMKRSKKDFEQKMSSPISKIKEALKELRDLETEVTNKFDIAIKAGTDWMVKFRAEEDRLLAIQNAEAEAIRLAAEEEIARKQRLIEAAKTPQMRGRLTAQVEQATRALVEAHEACKTPVKAANSVNRKTLKIQVNNKKALIAHILKLANTPGGEDLMSLVEVDMVEMNAFRKLDFARTKRTTPGDWLPGVSVIEEVGMMGYRRG